MQLPAPVHAPNRPRLAPAGSACTLWPVQRQHHVPCLHRSSHGTGSTQAAQQQRCRPAVDPCAAPGSLLRQIGRRLSVLTAASSSSIPSGAEAAVTGGPRRRRSSTSSRNFDTDSTQDQLTSAGDMPFVRRQAPAFPSSSNGSRVRPSSSSSSSSPYPTYQQQQQQPGVYTLSLKWYHRASIQQLHDGLLQRAGGGYADVAALAHMMRQASEPEHAQLALQALEAVRSARVAQGRMEYFSSPFAAQFVRMVRRCVALDVLLEGMGRGGVYGLLLSRKRVYPLMKEWAQQGRVSAVEAVYGALPAAGIPHDRINIYIMVRALANNGKKAEAAQLVEEWKARGLDLKPAGVRLVQGDSSMGEEEGPEGELQVVQESSE